MKSVPRWASSKRPTRLAIAPVNAPFACPKSSASASGSGIAAALNSDEALIRPRAVVVNRPGDQLLAGAGLALDQDGAVHRRHELEALEHRLHRGALADDVVEAVAIAKLCAQLGVLLAEARLIDRRCQHARQVRELHRLDEEVDRAAFDCGDRILDAAESGHDDGDDFRITGHRRVEDVEAVGVGELQVDDESVVGEAFQPVERIGAGGRLGDRESLFRQMLRNDFSEIVVVVDDEHALLGSRRHNRHSREFLLCRLVSIEETIATGGAGQSPCHDGFPTLDVLVIGDQLDVHNLLVGISDSSHGLTAMADRPASRKSS